MFETSYSDSVMDAGCECAPWVRSANPSDSFQIALRKYLQLSGFAGEVSLRSFGLGESWSQLLDLLFRLFPASFHVLACCRCLLQLRRQIRFVRLKTLLRLLQHRLRLTKLPAAMFFSRTSQEMLCWENHYFSHRCEKRFLRFFF